MADALRARAAAVGPGEYLFHSPGYPTTPMRLPSSGSWFTEAVARLQAEDPSFPHITPHGLRHTAASLLISAGATVLVVSRQLGHEDAAMALNTYADLFDDDLGSVSG
ncbi:tyrosine-type recombinase/integrase [Corynebacterium tuberculostearicum]|uniref:tyrosine-type recombinase/integrase n=1 Tax=Corynebacterium tuberculostearicum TaxID=38304 RepID=UPI003463C8FF